MIIRTPRVQTPDTRKRVLVGHIEKRNGRPNTTVTGEKFAALSFFLLTPSQLDYRLTEAHRG